MDAFREGFEKNRAEARALQPGPDRIAAVLPRS
jgi:hypothetical protein